MRRDPNFTMKDLQKAADKFLAAGQEYKDATQKAGLNVGAVIWYENSHKGLCVFTRGEYRDTILRNIPEVGQIYNLGVVLEEASNG